MVVTPVSMASSAEKRGSLPDQPMSGTASISASVSLLFWNRYHQPGLNVLAATPSPVYGGTGPRPWPCGPWVVALGDIKLHGDGPRHQATVIDGLLGRASGKP